MAENKYLDEHGLATLVDQVRIFRGTRQQWDLLSTAQKKLYSGAELTEDTLSGNFDVYSTSEVKTNKVWIDGKPIYRKVYDCGALPNNTSKSIPAVIQNLDKVLSVKGYTISGAVFRELPIVTANGSEQVAVFYNTTGEIVIYSSSDRSDFTESYVILEYTKTTD